MIVFAREPVFAPTGRVFAHQLNIGEYYQETLLRKDVADSPNKRDTHISWSDLLDGFVSIINISNDFIMQPLSEDIVPEDTLFEIDNITRPSHVLDRLVELKLLGFRFVASADAELSSELLALVDFAKIHVHHQPNDKAAKLKAIFKKHRVKTIAVNINDQTTYELAIQDDYDYYQGFFFLDKRTKSSEELPANKLAVLRLLSEIKSQELDIRRLEKVFEQDATLSYLLFRYINNPLVNKYQEITSIRHALSYLGEVMIKKFIAIVSLTQLNDENTPELLQVSLVRAKFCELISLKIQPKSDAMVAFLTGLFSLIDVILAREMSFLMTKVALPEEIKSTLLNKNGDLYPMIRASKGMESAHWDSVLAFLKSTQIDKDELTALYVQAIKWANDSGLPESSDYPVKKVANTP